MSTKHLQRAFFLVGSSLPACLILGDRKIAPRKITQRKIAPQQIPQIVRVRVQVRIRVGDKLPGGNLPGDNFSSTLIMFSSNFHQIFLSSLVLFASNDVPLNIKKQLTEVFYKTAVHKNFAIFTGKNLCWSLFLLKLEAFRSATSLKRDSNTDVFQ